MTKPAAVQDEPVLSPREIAARRRSRRWIREARLRWARIRRIEFRLHPEAPQNREWWQNQWGEEHD